MQNEYERFLSIRDRRLLQPPLTGTMLMGRRVLVTGGTGCIGSELMRQLLDLGCSKVGSVAIGPTAMTGPPPGHYYHCDIRIPGELDAVMAKGWDAVFHCAAQREPGIAERGSGREQTITTNVFGTAAVLNSAFRHDIGLFVHASTGKALRPFSPHVYTATKRIAEFLLAQSTIPHRAGARFTHVVDNSIIHRRLLKWAQDGRPIRLHADDILFYAQSAKESASLLIGAADCSGAYEADIHAIRDLGEPINLTAMVRDLIGALGSSSEIIFTGYDEGYEDAPFPGLYDPATANDHSPLLNAFEADIAFAPYPAVDAFPLRFAQEPFTGNFDLGEVSWLVMASAMSKVRPSLAKKVVRLCMNRPLSIEHAAMLAVIDQRAAEEVRV